VLRNITRNKLTLEALKKSEAQYRAVVEDQTELIFRFNTDATINFANEAFCRFFQTTLKTALNRDCKEVLGEQNAEEFREHADKIRAQQIPFMSFEQKFINKEEGEKWLQWTLRGIRTVFNTSIDEFQAVGRDITQLKQTQSALLLAKDLAEKATRAKSEFLAIMSHEIRTPMNGVIGMASLLANTNLSEEQKEYVEAIKSSGESLLSIINDILDFSKIESGKLDLEKHPFELNECIESIIDIFSPRLYEKNLNFNYIIEPNVPATIIGDLTRLRQALINFVGNAIKFTHVGSITVRFRINREINPEQVEIECSIQDTGIGISEDRLHLLFKPFSQVDSSTTRKYGGTGLGLAICAKLAELMGGKCWVQSAPNKGSTFYFSFIAGKKQTTIKRYPSKIALAIGSALLQEALEAYLATRVEEYFIVSADQLSDTLANPKFNVLLIDQVFLMKNREKVEPFLSATNLPKALIINSNLSPAFSGQAPVKFTYTLNFPLKLSAVENILREISAAKDGAANPLPGFNEATETLVTTEMDLAILVAEDNPINQKLIERILSKAGFRNIKVVENGKLAVEQALCHPFDLILMDIQMPEIDGLAAARQITSYYKETKNTMPPFIIAMTANVMPSDKEDCLNAGMDDYISKPIRLEEVQMKIRLYSKVILQIKKLDYHNLLSSTIVNTALAKESMGINVYEAFAKELERNLNKITALAKENLRPMELILRHIRHIQSLAHNLGAQLVAEVCQTFASQLNAESEPLLYEEFAILVNRLFKQTLQAICAQNN
jgi:PAS domain S-box-containing protein